jgi:hypothetical protein
MICFLALGPNRHARTGWRKRQWQEIEGEENRNGKSHATPVLIFSSMSGLGLSAIVHRKFNLIWRSLDGFNLIVEYGLEVVLI